ncbi:MAG: hypothetical protein Q7J82_07360 [Coriobacteriia bacterium]|nr:hypothetical protein [Coriobacteriia bacterium]
MKRLLGLLLVSALALSFLTGCSGTSANVTFETVGEGVSTEGRPVFYEFFTQG